MNPDYQRSVGCRYLDPLDLIWLATAKRLGLTVRRSPLIFAATDGTGLMKLGDRDTLDEDDCTAQMIFHEICHWITNGRETFHQRDWGFPLVELDDWRELSGLRVQAWLGHRFDIPHVMASTAGFFRQYYDLIEPAPLEPLDDSDIETKVITLTREAVERAQTAPWQPHLDQALAATRLIKTAVEPFLSDYVTDIPHDTLPSLWATDPPSTSRQPHDESQ